MKVRRLAGRLLCCGAALEFAAAVYVALFGSFASQLGPISIRGGSGTKLFAIAVLATCAAVWLLRPFQSAARQSRLAFMCRSAAYLALIAGVANLIAPFVLQNFLFSQDGAVHQTYAYLFDRALRQGQFPVRWVEGVGYGKGQPLFNYYQVGLYYVIALIHACGPSLSLSFKLAISFAWLGGTFFTFLWLNPLGRFPAVLGAALFAWSPYVMLDAYVRTAYPELLAVALVPAVFWSLDRTLRTGHPIFSCALALTTGLLLISHLPVSLIVAPVCALYVLGSWVMYRHPQRQLVLVALGVTIGVGLASFHIIPAILELDAIQIRSLTREALDYHRHFIVPTAWLDWDWGYASSGTTGPNHMSFQIGIIQWLAIIAAAIRLVVLTIRRDGRAWPVAGWLSVFGGTLFMTTGAAVHLWDRVAPLAFLQFPWRFLIVPTIACSALAALVLASLRDQTNQALIVVCAIALQWSVTRDYRLPAWTRPRAAITIDVPGWWASRNAQIFGFREPAYDPVSVTDTSPIGAERWATTTARAEIVPLLQNDAQLVLRVEAQEEAGLTVRMPFFRGWRLTLDDTAITPTIQPGTGFMTLQVPAGSHRVEARFTNTPVRTVANAIAVLSIFSWVLLLYHARRKWTPS